MMPFEDFLEDRLAGGGFTTEDALASFLPLMRQVVAAHEEGQVAPLEGLNDLHVEGVQIWFEESRLQPPVRNRSRLAELDRRDRSAVEVVTESRVVTDKEAGSDHAVNLHLGRRDEPIMHPVYLPGYVSWEHLIDHHDPLTDVFSLGLILASLACGLNLSDDRDLAAFVECRGNLFALRQGLHPVVARAITWMTELDRHRRPQDLSALLKALENYRDQDVNFDVELARVGGFGKKDLHGKQQVVLSKLQERLFEISRRNRLLHFRATMQTVNLTHASVPLSFDVRNIRPDQILVWNDEFQKRIATGRPISLNKYLDFHEAIYLPSLLDGIRLDARRDRNEYGFAQLRLIACFLRWANLKESTPVEYESPLVLVPVELTKKKGVRDTFHLKTLDPVAEINPVVRHLFKQLYDIDLPETIDLEKSSLDDLHAFLVHEIESSEPAVSLQKIDRPRIDVIHDRARRRVDQYRRRARLSGRGIRRFLDLDYSYDPANYHPLGLQLFQARVRPAPTRLEVIVGASPTRRQYAVAPETPPPAENKRIEKRSVEKKQTLYHLRQGGEGNPYVWQFDLCSVTLGNFKYRKMSLVRDYRELLEENPLNQAFDATFSLTPRPVDVDPTDPLKLPERYHVVPCDPTQAAAISQSRTGSSYIIQGPPGTGKSQTITNLIADYVARGKRVLFVCEKRAAIDVVYHRLRQRGLDRLSCLIHDSQGDKKEFVMDLKRTYEEFLAEPAESSERAEVERTALVRRIEQELRPLEEHQATMTSRPESAGVDVRALLERLIELRSFLPGLSPRQSERLPSFVDCHAHRDRLERFSELLRPIQPDGLLSRHPLRLLNSTVLSAERPIEYVAEHLPPAAEAMQSLIAVIRRAELPAECCESFEKALDVIRYAVEADLLAQRKLFSLLRAESDEAGEFTRRVRRFDKHRRKLRKRQEAARHWKVRLSAADVALALRQARDFEHDRWRFFKLSWWKLRSLLNRSYDFAAHRVRPSRVQVLEWLEAVLAAEAAVQEADAEQAEYYEVEGTFAEFADRISQFPHFVASQPGHVQAVHRCLLKQDDADDKITALAKFAPTAERLSQSLERFFTDFAELAPGRLLALLQEADDALDELPDFLEAARELAELSPDVATALRTNEWTIDELEAAAAQRCFGDVLQEERQFAKFDGQALARHVRKLDRLTQKWQTANSRVLYHRVLARFQEHVKISTLPAAQLTPEQKDFKREYARGRRELEHEFGKSMRYKPIRQLVVGESGMVVKDLKPIWLMSPLSVSDTLPLDSEHFDVVIFDEASQILLEEAVPSLFRAAQTIVVGDEMQLPPTNFFSARRADDDEQLQFEEDGELVEYDLESNSFLNHAARNLPSTMLGWHYRSRSESLISFSNWAFYGGRLLTVPEESLAPAGRPELVVTSVEDAAGHAAELLNRAVSFHFIEHGVYQNRRNRAEAEYIAELVRELLQVESHPTIGIVAFSEAQQGEIESALQRLAEEDRDFRDRLEAEWEREEEGQFAGLLVKNLENIQGDERDVIVMSVCYAPDAAGKMRMNFGPINQSGGEKRLNVAFSRAKRHMALVSSIRSSAITNDYNDGANCLKNYLQYAECSSVGDGETAGRILRSLSLSHQDADAIRTQRNAVVDQLAEAFRQRGYVVDRGIGQSQFRCDLALRRDGDETYRLGILVDTAEYYRQTDLLERDLMKPNLLRAFGWRAAVVLSRDWWENRADVIARLERLAEQEDESDSGETEPEPPGVPASDVEQAAGREETLAEEESLSSESESGDADSLRYFELVSGSSARFWEISVRGAEQTVRFGRIGSRGQSRTKSFADGPTAEQDALRQIRKKLSKGYTERLPE